MTPEDVAKRIATMWGSLEPILKEAHALSDEMHEHIGAQSGEWQDSSTGGDYMHFLVHLDEYISNVEDITVLDFDTHVKD